MLQVVLTGMPIRVRQRFAVVKHLFYDPLDVRWFKPAELVTKCGLRVKIKEPVGTHGLLKAGFSAPIKQNDTIMLILYKRVFPKFPTAGVTVW
jgi:pre-rRNA-processing protein TSR1